MPPRIPRRTPEEREEARAARNLPMGLKPLAMRSPFLDDLAALYQKHGLYVDGRKIRNRQDLVVGEKLAFMVLSHKYEVEWVG